MNKLTLLCICIAILNCQDSKTETGFMCTQPSEKVELINILVFQDGYIQINGQKISESALKNHLVGLPIGENTNARILLDENAWFGSFTNVQSLLVNQKVNIKNIFTKTYDSKTFKRIGQEILIVDVLDDGSAQFNGNNIHPDDLILALNSHQETATEVWLSISEKATVGPVFDAKKQILENGFKITYL